VEARKLQDECRKLEELEKAYQRRLAEKEEKQNQTDKQIATANMRSAFLEK
jgi:hypothetical protein